MRRFFGCILLTFFVIGVHADDRRIFRAITASDGLADNSAQTIKCTKTGRMTITTIGDINFYDGANFSTINPDNEVKFITIYTTTNTTICGLRTCTTCCVWN